MPNTLLPYQESQYSFYLCNIVDDKDHWWRGCKLDVDEMMGCAERMFTYNGQEYLVDECDCNTNECNRDMQPIPSPTTQGNKL